MKLTDEEIVAMAVAVIAEDEGVSPQKIVVHSFREIHDRSLKSYLAENHISFHKYQLEDEQK